MANVTDPLAQTVHGTNPQNLIEYITRQKIYDSLYWKETCFGLSASDVAAKASELKAVGGTYGGNNKPCKFLCLCLKMLQIQPEEGIVEEFLSQDDFKYVRALGAFYLRLTGRPAEIFELIEPLYNDFRKLRFRTSTGWKIVYMDEMAHDLLTCDRYCGIALPHLPKREVLVNAGYLDGPRRSALMPLIEEKAGGDAEKFLEMLAEDGSEGAKIVLEERRKRKREIEEREAKLIEQEEASQKERSRNHCEVASYDRKDRYDRDRSRDRYANSSNGRGHYDARDSRRSERYDDNYDRDRENYRDRDRRRREDDRGYRDNGDDYGRDQRHRGDDRGYRGDRDTYRSRDQRHDVEEDWHKSREHKHHKDKKYGSLFKSQRHDKPLQRSNEQTGSTNSEEEKSEEYWNEQRAKLGLKPLEK